ncbi:hypothetical protein V7S43_009179 [Phytophthora oleae]|uniref:Uncharacterized protein n=1 Tax=Phytophthora oleae TaxID=2107226 RepID=A0ABD3FFM0_9STRA
MPSSTASLEPAPLLVVTLALSDKAVADLPHVASLISSYLDCSVNIPLHQACETGSLDLLDRIWFHSQRPHGEDWRWCPAASLQTNRHYKRWQFSQSLIQAIRRRDLALVDWIFRHFTCCVSDVEVVEKAASTGQLEILKFLLEKDSGHTQEEYEVGTANGDGNGVTWGGDDMELAVENGHSDVVRWLLEHTGDTQRVEFGVFIKAVLSGDLPIVKLLVSSGFFRMAQPHSLIDLAASGGHLELLQWLVEQNFLDEEHRVRLSSKHLNINTWLVESGLECGVEQAFAEACGEGPLPVVWWLADYMNMREVVLDVDTAESAMNSAARHGHLEVVKWLIKRGLGKGSTLAIHFAAMNGHLEVAKYLHAQDFTGCYQKTLQETAKGGHLAVVQWLWTQFHDDPKADLLCEHGGDEFFSRGPPFTNEMTAAASNGHLEVIQYLHTIALTLAGKKRKRGGSSMDDVVSEAAINGHLDVVRWVCTHTTVNSTEHAMTGAARNGHFPVVKWLHENIPHEDFRTVVLDKAAFCGDMPLWKWLHTNRPNERWSTIAIYSAARRGHLHVLRWLLDHEILYKDNDFSVPLRAMKMALKGTHFDALLFVHYKFEEWSNNPVLVSDGLYNGSYDEHMVAWCQEELREPSGAD